MVNLSLFRNLFIKSFFTIIIIFIKILLLFLLLLLLLLLLLSSCRPSQYQDCLSSGSYICNQYLSSISATICNGRGGGGGYRACFCGGYNARRSVSYVLVCRQPAAAFSRLQAVS